MQRVAGVPSGFNYIQKLETYPEIGDANFKCALWTFKQQPALKMWAHCRISIVFL